MEWKGVLKLMSIVERSNSQFNSFGYILENICLDKLLSLVIRSDVFEILFVNKITLIVKMPQIQNLPSSVSMQ